MHVITLQANIDLIMFRWDSLFVFGTPIAPLRREPCKSRSRDMISNLLVYWVDRSSQPFSVFNSFSMAQEGNITRSLSSGPYPRVESFPTKFISLLGPQKLKEKKTKKKKKKS